MSRIEKYQREYGEFSGDVLSSIARTGAAGRSGDPRRIAHARKRHAELMAYVRAALAVP
jgi:hypothetical protein